MFKKFRGACSELIRRGSKNALYPSVFSHFSFSAPSAIPILPPVRGVLRGSAGRSRAVATARGRRTASTTCAEIPFARGVVGGSGTGSMRRRVGAVGCLGCRKGWMGLIECRRAFGRRGWFFTMSSTALGYAGLGGRGGGNGHIIRRAALRWRMSTTVEDIIRDRGDITRQKKRGFGCLFGGALG